MTAATPPLLGFKDLKTLAEVRAAVSDKEFIFVIGQPNCPHCETLKPVLKALGETAKVYYMDHTAVRGGDVNELKSFYTDLRVPKILAKREGESEMHVCWAPRTVDALQAHLRNIPNKSS